ncbi:MAG: RHS repeat-associated core domain-containing protein, partial [Pirellulales bacterium]|nr:RHS repeat-associated core domain-containing protein [Pirellulales bacterium]
ELSQGTAGAKSKQREVQYKTSTDPAQSLFVIGKETRYRNEDGTGAVDTGYSYQWYTSPAVAIQEKVTTLPAIPVSQHGDGTAATTKQYYDQEGKLTFTQNERGIVNKHTYDSGTELLTKTQLDVPATEPGLPSGWSVAGSTPHQNVTTDFQYDDQGRRIEVLGPEHQVDLDGTAANVRIATWTVYQESVSGDQNWTALGYRRSSDSSEALVNPVTITMFDKAGKPTDQIQSARSTGSGKLSSTDTFLRSDWTRWSVSFYNPQGQQVTSRGYHTLPPQNPDLGLAGVGSDPGSEHTHYEETHFGYDPNNNQQVRLVTAEGTILRTVYDAINRSEQSWLGTDDVPSGGTWQDWSPSNTAGTNLVKLSQNTYDGGSAGGASLLTRVQRWVDANTIRTTNFAYDYRGRRTLAYGEESRCSQRVYNNLDQATETTEHDGCTGSPPVPGTLLGKRETFFDDRGRVYQHKTYAVDPSTGVVGNALLRSTWYDPSGNVIKTIAPDEGETYARSEYDNLGRTSLSLTAYEDVAAPNDEVVITQSDMTYDKASRLLSTVTKLRDVDTPIANPTFRVSYAANWYDGIGRVIARANYGTHGGSPWTRPATTPNRSDDVQVSTMAFDNAGETYRSVDPQGAESRHEFDVLGRTTKTVANYQTSGSGADINNTTEFTYTADNQLETVTVKMASAAADEVTTYLYGVSAAGGSELTVNNLLFAIEHPEDSSTKREEIQYNRQGEAIQRKDQNGTTHQYDYDGLGRQTQDRVTAFGTSVDQSIKRIATSYDARGMVNGIASLDHATVGSGTVINEIELVHNHFRQLSTEYISHDGAVSPATTPKIQYSYAAGASNSNQIRPTSMTYPSSRVIHFGYGAGGSVNDQLNRVFAIEDGATNLVEYKYLGAGTFVVANYTQPSVKMDLWGGTAGSYDGLDRFGRIVDLPWIQHSGGATDLVRFQYGYNRASSPLYARDEMARNQSAHLDQLYSYDGLQRLIDLQQGQLNVDNTSVSSKTLTQDWELDQAGNWSGFDQGITNLLNQTRTHNKVNEITAINESVGQPQWITPAYDDAGNSTELPQAGDPTQKFKATYDAWNRLVKVESSNGQTTLVAKYQYDGRNHRLTKQRYDSSGNLQSTTKFFENFQWQCLEEQLTPVVGTATTTQYVWGARYLDDLVCRDIGSERLYALQDRQFKTVALSNTSGSVVERYSYTPYGESKVYDANFGVRSSSNYDWVYRFTGRRLDQETGLYYFRNRYYHAGLGRFCSRDPIGFQGGTSNLYEAMAGSPVLYRDPLGLEIEICCSPAMIGPSHPEYPAAGVYDPDDPLTAIILRAMGIDLDDLRMLNRLPNHCYIKFTCPGHPGFTTEANSDIYIAPGYDFIGNTLTWTRIQQLLDYLGVEYPEIPLAWLVLPLENRRGIDTPSGTCSTCTTVEDTDCDCASQEDCIRTEMEFYPQGDYDWIHHNSNTYAGTVARACCDNIDVPGGIDRAWGWNDTPNPAVPHIPIPLVRLLLEIRERIMGIF